MIKFISDCLKPADPNIQKEEEKMKSEINIRIKKIKKGAKYEAFKKSSG